MGEELNENARLSDDDRAQADRLGKDALVTIGRLQAAFTELGVMVGRTLGDNRQAVTAVVDAHEAQASDGASFKVTFYDEQGRCLYVWQDPPGITRPCTDDKPGPMSPGPTAAVLLSQ